MKRRLFRVQLPLQLTHQRSFTAQSVPIPLDRSEDIENRKISPFRAIYRVVLGYVLNGPPLACRLTCSTVLLLLYVGYIRRRSFLLWVGRSDRAVSLCLPPFGPLLHRRALPHAFYVLFTSRDPSLLTDDVLVVMVG